MDYLLFLLVNANLFLRPAELVQDLERLPLYFWFIIACIIAAIPKLLGLISFDSLLRHPTTLCVFGVFGFVTLSHFANSDLETLSDDMSEFLKVVVYFVLFLAIMNGPRKLRFLLGCVVLFGVVTSGIAILEFHQFIDLPNLKSVEELYIDENTGDLMRVKRMMLTGILHDPNEFCLFLGVLCLFTLHQLGNHRIGIARFAWLAPLAVFLYGIFLTKSRGGLLALLAGLGTYAVCAWGVRRASLIGFLLLPVLVAGLLLGGRQTSISLTEGTGRARLELWVDWLMKFRENPVFGESPKIAEFAKEEVKELRWDYQQVAHNSYLQSLADLGFLGGMCFIGAFLFAFRTMAAYAPAYVTILDPDQRRLFPFLFGALVAYMTGMMSLSLCYVLPTYFVLALPIVFTRMTATEPVVEPVRIDARSMRQVVFASVGMLGFVFVLIKVFRV